MKKISKKISSLLVGCLTLGMLSSPASIAETTAPAGFVDADNGLYIKKSVSPVDVEKGQYRLTFDVSGDRQKGEIPDTEIVLLIDRSGSMTDEMAATKKAAINFCEQVLKDKGGKVKISILAYSYNIQDIVIPSSNKLSDLQTAINSITVQKNGETNTERAIRRAKEIISNKVADKKYVVLFTDGLPTRNDSYSKYDWADANGNHYSNSTLANSGYPKNMLILGNHGTRTHNNDIIAAQRAYHDIVGETSHMNLGGIAPVLYCEYDGKDYQVVGNKESKSVKLKKSEIDASADTNIKFYTIGLFTNTKSYISEGADDIDKSINNSNIENIQEESKSTQPTPEEVKYDFSSLQDFSKTESDMAKEFLYSIQNVENDKKTYEDNYYTSDAGSLTKIFESIAKQIQAETSPYIAKDVVIKDTVTSDFSIVAEGKDDIEGMDSDDTVTIKGQEIVFNLGNIQDVNSDLSKPDKTISFIIQVKDPYLFGEDIPTNDIATIEYKTPIDNIQVKDKEFNIPIVTIDPKIATITVTKIVNNDTNNDKKPDFTPSNDMEDEVFPILMQQINSNCDNQCNKHHNEQYNMGLTAGETKTMTVYLKGCNTDISTDYTAAYKDNTDGVSNEFDETLNFITVGEYSVSEIVPMNYELQDIKIRWAKEPESIENKQFETKTGFTINKGQKIIDIVVTNKCINDSYFHDNDNIPNELTLTN